MPEPVRITDVSPRDGLQNEPGVIPTADKARLVELLCATGVDEIEVTSFVSPKWVPQLGDAKELCFELARSIGDDRPILSALIPNLRGLDALGEVAASSIGLQQGLGVEFPHSIIDRIALFTAASQSFSQKNTNASIEETLDRFRDVMRQERLWTGVRAYVSCVFACPFEGPIAPAAVADVCARLIDLGVDELDLGDTIGAGTAESTARLLDVVRDRIGDGWFERRAITLHLHDTFGRAAECVKTALDLGVRSFDGSVAGLGGCPYASTPGKRAPGNIDTRLLVETIHNAGYTTGVDLGKLDEAAAFAREIVARARSTA